MRCNVTVRLRLLLWWCHHRDFRFCWLAGLRNMQITYKQDSEYLSELCTDDEEYIGTFYRNLCCSLFSFSTAIDWTGHALNAALFTWTIEEQVNVFKPFQKRARGKSAPSGGTDAECSVLCTTHCCHHQAALGIAGFLFPLWRHCF